LKDKLHVAGSKLKVWQPHGDLSTFDLRRSTFDLRLPSEAEWEKAARGGLTLSSIQYPASGIEYQASSIQNRIRRYPWGETPEQDRLTPEHANYNQTGINATSAVGAFPWGRSPYGVLDLSGNVWEWCQTRWVYNYKDYDKTEDNDEEGESHRVVRGGAFLYSEGLVCCAFRDGDDPDDVGGDQGFRVVAVPIDAGR
jgi:iron(II)-dependent oxidoreductase